jgi:hypothetical protein
VPAEVRSRIVARSNSANEPIICIIMRPAGVVVSMFSVIDRKPASALEEPSFPRRRRLCPGASAIPEVMLLLSTGCLDQSAGTPEPVQLLAQSCTDPSQKGLS